MVYATIYMMIKSMKRTNPDKITDEAIIHYLNELIKYYFATSNTGIGITCEYRIKHENYAIEALKCAYLYRYFTCIADACKEHWIHYYRQNEDLIDDIIDDLEFDLNICCIGGGPGTDLIAVYLFLQEMKIDITFNATILDNENWDNEIGCVLADFAPDLKSRTNCMKYNVFDQLDSNSEIYKTLHNADIVSMVKFVSEFAHGPWDESSDGPVEMRVTNKLMPVFDALKPGAMVFYLDNSGGGYTEVFEAAATKAGLKILSRMDKVFFSSSDPNLKFIKIAKDQYPQKNLVISSMLWQK